jgi:hypothetical protein
MVCTGSDPLISAQLNSAQVSANWQKRMLLHLLLHAVNWSSMAAILGTQALHRTE